MIDGKTMTTAHAVEHLQRALADAQTANSALRGQIAAIKSLRTKPGYNVADADGRRAFGQAFISAGEQRKSDDSAYGKYVKSIGEAWRGDDKPAA